MSQQPRHDARTLEWPGKRTGKGHKARCYTNKLFLFVSFTKNWVIIVTDCISELAEWPIPSNNETHYHQVKQGMQGNSKHVKTHQKYVKQLCARNPENRGKNNDSSAHSHDHEEDGLYWCQVWAIAITTIQKEHSKEITQALTLWPWWKSEPSPQLPYWKRHIARKIKSIY